MNVLTFKYLLLLIGLLGAHARSSLSESASEEEGSGEGENGIDDNGIKDADDELEKMPEEREKPDKEAKGVLIEGDVLVSDSKVRNAAVAPKLWPGGIVYYKIDNTKFSSAVVKNITLAMSQISSKTLRCIKFQERTVQRNYINFVKDDGCFSEIGMKGLDQELSLGTGCNQVGTMMHEILHAIGVSHQHTRNDRDDYVKVNWSQIKASVKVNFEKRDNDNDTNVPYCFNSIMHYGNFAFTSRKDVKTLTSKTRPSMTFGQRVKLENCDIMYLKKLYQCGRGGSGIPIETSSRSSYSRPSSTIPRSRPSGSSPRKTAFAGEK